MTTVDRPDYAMHANRRIEGFTLVELSMSLFIIALVIGGGFAAIGGMLDRAQITETRQNLDQFKQSVLGFSARTQRLPSYTGSAAIPPVADEVSSLVPRMFDFWGIKLVYLYDPELARSDFGATICAKRATNIILRTCDSAACTSFTDMPNIAFAAFSSGKNMVNQTDAANPAAAPPLTAREETPPTNPYSGPVGSFGSANQKVLRTYPQGTSVGLFSSPTSNTLGYDDMLVVVTLDELRQRIGCSAMPLRLVNADLPMGTQGASYSVDMITEGGVPISSTESVRWCVESADAGIGGDLVFQVKNRLGADYIPARAITRQAPGTCTLATTLETNTTIWGTGDRLRLVGATTGLLAATGGARTRTLTVFVRDNQNNDPSLTAHDPHDNIVSRSFVVPINGS